MTMDKTKFIATTILTAIIASTLTLPFVQMPLVCSSDVTAPEKVLNFLTEVAGLDTTKYAAKIIIEDNPVKYTLTSDNSTIDVLCQFRNGALVWCHVYQISGSPFLTHPAINPLDSAKIFLEKYQNYSKATYLQPMKNTLCQLTEISAVTKTDGNVKLTVYPMDYGFVLYDWMNEVNGIINPYNRMGFGLKNGVFEQFADDWNLNPVGNAEVKISKDQALSIATARIKTFSYEIGSQTVGNLTVSNLAPFAELTMQPRNNMLYPHWEIYLPLDKVYPGEVTSVHIMMWADTGEISSIKATGTLGGSFPNNATNPTAPPTELPTSPSSTPQSTSKPASTTSSEPNSISSQSPTSPSTLLQPSPSFSAHSTDNGSSESSALQFVAVIVVVTVAVVAAALLLKRKTK
jgi:hypothetical protein